MTKNKNGSKIPGRKIESNESGEQCDPVATLFDQDLAIYKNEKIQNIRPKLVQNHAKYKKYKLSVVCQKLKICQIWSHWLLADWPSGQ